MIRVPSAQFVARFVARFVACFSAQKFALGDRLRELADPAPAMDSTNTNTLLLVIIAILLPPVAVGLKEGIGLALVLNIVLTLLFWLPGFLHALWVVLR
jgi:uncharacterized membrane protein YqaE (UPF0057 family)